MWPVSSKRTVSSRGCRPISYLPHHGKRVGSSKRRPDKSISMPGSQRYFAESRKHSLSVFHADERSVSPNPADCKIANNLQTLHSGAATKPYALDRKPSVRQVNADWPLSSSQALFSQVGNTLRYWRAG